MRISDYTKKLLILAQTLHRWAGHLAGLDTVRRRQVARYADQIAGTLARAADALLRLKVDPADQAAHRTAIREFGRLAGYLETIVGVLQHHLDGRKVSGVKRRLEQLGLDGVKDCLGTLGTGARVERLFAAEGYFRALADSLRV
jgi:hypothetical protein